MITKQRASIALIVILIAATIAIVSYVMTNGTNPIGPSPVTPGTADITVSQQGTPVVVTDEINFSDGNICAVAAALVADVSLCDDITIVDRLSLTTTDQEFIDITGAATMFFSTRDDVVFMLDNNNNTPGADLCIQGSGITTDTWCVDKNGNITLATIDGDLNTFVDVKPDQWDNLDAPANDECATYQDNQVEWEACGSGGGFTYDIDLPIYDGSTPSTTTFAGVPGIAFIGGGANFVTPNDIYIEPFQVSQSVTINQVSFEVTSAGNPGDGCRIGLYEAGANWQVGDLVEDWGIVLDDSTGWKHTTVNTTIGAGSYLKVMLCNSSPAVFFHNSAGFSTGNVDTAVTAATRYIRQRTVTSPTAGQYAGGFIDPGDLWDGFTYGNGSSEIHILLLRWS